MSYEKDYMYAIDRSDEYLEHYGIKGMKWGVRKALESGNSRALARQYRKASRKLARLEKRATSGKKYARRAALLGAGAAAAGGLAAAGTTGIGNALSATSRVAGSGMRGIGGGMNKAGAALGGLAKGVKNQKIRGAMQSAAAGLGFAGRQTQRAGDAAQLGGWKAGGALQTWGNKNGLDIARDTAATRIMRQNQAAANASFNKRIADTMQKGIKGNGVGPATSAVNRLKAQQAGANKVFNEQIAGSQKHYKFSNNTLARAGAAAVGAGLLGAAGYNAYRAATTKKAAAKAAQWKKEMNSAFKGTQYANGGSAKPSTKKRRRR